MLINGQKRFVDGPPWKTYRDYPPVFLTRWHHWLWLLYCFNCVNITRFMYTTLCSLYITLGREKLVHALFCNVKTVHMVRGKYRSFHAKNIILVSNT